MSERENLILIGPMGAGKTTIGRRLARTLGLRFVDADRALEERTGARIALIFDVEGEAGFRDREAGMLAELTGENGIVLATGGGAVLREENRRRLKAGGRVVYLAASADRLYERTRRDRSRPLLQTEDPRARIAELLAERDPLYRECADLVVDTDRQSLTATLKLIEQDYRQECER